MDELVVQEQIAALVLLYAFLAQSSSTEHAAEHSEFLRTKILSAITISNMLIGVICEVCHADCVRLHLLVMLSSNLCFYHRAALLSLQVVAPV